MSKLIKPKKSIVIHVSGQKYNSKLYCFGDITSVFSDSYEDDEEYDDEYPEIVLKAPKVISRSVRSQVILYLNQAAFARQEGALFSYNKEIYNSLCLGSWETLFNRYRNKKIFVSLLYEYLSTYNNSGYTHVENLEDGKCLLCSGYKNYDDNDICGSCVYKIKSPSGDSIYYDDISDDFDPKLVKFDNKIGNFIYSGKVDD